MKISIVVAVDLNNAIGANGALLWHLPEDMKRFKEITMGHCVLMGRKTFESIPEKFRPLPGRDNLVITHQPNFVVLGCETFSNVEKAVTWAKKKRERELMVIGGGEIYKQLLPFTDTIYLTRVHHQFKEADTFFPIISLQEWDLHSVENHIADEKHQYNFEFIRYERRKS